MLVMDEGRKRVLLIAAAILAARKLCQLESTRPSPALHSIIADAIVYAERIMQRIDMEWQRLKRTLAGDWDWSDQEAGLDFSIVRQENAARNVLSLKE